MFVEGKISHAEQELLIQKDMLVILYVKENLKINEFNNSIGIVGARRCTAVGKKTAINTARMAVDANTAVISGMAKGIDSYAHTAAIKSCGYTIAALGNGVDICYPKEHEKLHEEIAERGCVLSEYPPGTPLREYYFPKRNHLIAGLSDKLYVIDAGRNSGTLSTVDYSKNTAGKLSCAVKQ
ncbi:MAG: DNA-processing protein DprA [Lachnospiraceae bacterium]|nr:DNA-processing protein DprA [Lachnospiraceae bacterium]